MFPAASTLVTANENGAYVYKISTKKRFLISPSAETTWHVVDIFTRLQVPAIFIRDIDPYSQFKYLVHEILFISDSMTTFFLLHTGRCFI